MKIWNNIAQRSDFELPYGNSYRTVFVSLLLTG